MPDMNNFDKHLLEKMKQGKNEHEIRPEYADSIEKQLRSEGRLGQMMNEGDSLQERRAEERKEELSVKIKSAMTHKRFAFKKFGKIALICYVIIMLVLAFIILSSIVQRKASQTASASAINEERGGTLTESNFSQFFITDE